MFSFLGEVDLCEMWPNVHRVANIQKGSRRNMTLSLCQGSTPLQASANYIWIILIHIIYGLSRHVDGKTASSHVSYSLIPYSTVPKELIAIEWPANAAQLSVNTL
jgi:hypothetical protein